MTVSGAKRTRTPTLVVVIFVRFAGFTANKQAQFPPTQRSPEKEDSGTHFGPPKMSVTKFVSSRQVLARIRVRKGLKKANFAKNYSRRTKAFSLKLSSAEPLFHRPNPTVQWGLAPDERVFFQKVLSLVVVPLTVTFIHKNSLFQFLLRTSVSCCP